MKIRFLFFFVLCVTVMTMTAAPRSLRQAQDIAMKHASSVGIRTSRIAAVALESAKTSANVSDKISSTALEKAAASVSEGCFIFNHGDNEGFTIVGADDRLPEIVAYSDKGSIDPTNIPDGLKFYLELYKSKVERLNTASGDEIVSDAKKIHRLAGSKVAVAKMMSTTWNQTGNYNASAPILYGSTHASVGCTAVAFGQVLRYHANPNTMTKTIPGYTSSKSGYTFTIEGVSGDRTYNWSSMPNSSANSEVARLLYHAAVSIETMFGPSSGAYSQEIGNAVEYFGMTYSRRFSTSSYTTEQWLSYLDKSLDDGQPVVISGYNSNDVGHSFVADGRNTSGYYHINWGWGGSGDGYVDISVLNTNQGNFNENVNMVTGIRISPDSYSDPLEELKARYKEYKSVVFPRGDAQNAIDETAYTALDNALSSSKSVIDASSMFSKTQIEGSLNNLKAKYKAVVESRAPYPDGNYYIMAVQEYDDGTQKAFYAGDQYAGWKTCDTGDERFKWNLTYFADTKSYGIYNVGTGARLGVAYEGDNLSMLAPAFSAQATAVSLTPYDFDIHNDYFIEGIRRYTSTDGYGFFHQAGHENGAGTSGNITGWTQDSKASQWYLVPCEQITPEMEADKAERDALVVAATNLLNAKRDALAQLTPTGLVKNADQFYSEYTETKEGSYDALLDGDPSTFWHSAWVGGNVTPGTHYLQVTLLEPEDGVLRLKMTRRSSSDVDHVTELLVKASNDAQNWTEITTISLPFGSKTETLERFFTLETSYKYLRFYITNTYFIESGVVKDSRGYGHFGEFQLYNVLSEEEESAIAAEENALDALSSAIETAKAKKYPSKSEIDALKKALRQYYSLGNTNADNRLSITDITNLVALLKSNGQDDDLIKMVIADVNEDGKIDVQDIERTADLLLHK